jgi:hypothetical protein
MRKLLFSFIVLSLAVISSTTAWGQPNIDWEVLSSGGTDASSAGFQLDATIGQTATLQVAGGTRTLGQGYWFASGCCVGIRGDCNFDGTDANILDLTFLVDRIFRGGPPAVCPSEADLNSDGTTSNILDLTYLVDRIFRGGPPPGPC